jgi:hypothetical protein
MAELVQYSEECVAAQHILTGSDEECRKPEAGFNSLDADDHRVRYFFYFSTATVVLLYIHASM